MCEILITNTELCALCLKEITSPFSDLNTEEYKTQISLILPEIDISIIKSPVVCSDCSVSLINAYTFKCNCLDVYKRIASQDCVQTRLIDLFNKPTEFKKLESQGDPLKEEDIYDGNVSEDDEISNEVKEEETQVNISQLQKRFKKTVEREHDVIVIDDDDEDIKLKKKSMVQMKSVAPKHYCTICNEEFLYNSTYKQHVSKFHKQTIAEKRNYLCSICGITTTTKSSLLYHHRTHTGERPHKCPYCEKSFAQLGSCTMHIKCVHSKERPYVCDICGSTFAWKRSYDGHMLVIHNKEEKKHICTSCGAAFHFSHKLKEHMRSHTGARDYKCKVCERAFSQSVYLKRHMSVHTGEKRYACHLCSKRFSLSYNRTIHVRSCSRKIRPELKTDNP